MKDKTNEELAKILWDYLLLHRAVEKAEVIITLGSHDTRVAERGAELFLEGCAPYLLLSGGFGRLTDKKWSRPEADVFSEVVQKMGVPEESLLIENKSTNTEENLKFSMKILKEKKIISKNVILVHKPYMERRQFATWEKLFPEVKAYITSPQFSFADYLKNTHIPKNEIISNIVGEAQRIKEYPAKGFVIPQDIPNEVWQAYEELVKRGFTSQLIKK